MPTQCILLRSSMSKVLARAYDAECFGICLSQVFARGTFLFLYGLDKRTSLMKHAFVCMPMQASCACKQAFHAIKKNKFNFKKISWTLHELFSFDLQAARFQLIRLQLIRLNV
jgi:hypothetical protein